MQTPSRRAPLSFADIVDRVKPAVVSIHVTNGSPEGCAKGKPGARAKPRDFCPDLPDDHPLSEFFKRLPPEFRGQPGPNAWSADAGAGLGLCDLGRRLRGDQQPCHRRRQQDPGQLRQGQQVRRRARRHRSSAPTSRFSRSRPTRTVHRSSNSPTRLPRDRRLGAGRSATRSASAATVTAGIVSAQGPRHRLGSLRLHADRCRGEPR